MASYHDGSIIEVDFVKKKLIFKYGYKTNTQDTLELEQELEKILVMVYEITKDYDFKFQCRQTFEFIIQRCINGKQFNSALDYSYFKCIIHTHSFNIPLVVFIQLKALELTEGFLFETI